MVIGDLAAGMHEKIQSGDLVTLVGYVRNVDSTGRLDLAIMDQTDHTKTIEMEHWVGPRYLCKPSDTAYGIERDLKHNKLQRLQKERDQLMIEITALDDKIVSLRNK